MYIVLLVIVIVIILYLAMSSGYGHGWCYLCPACGKQACDCAGKYAKEENAEESCCGRRY